MHCYTKPERISHISNQVFEAVRSLIAAGISPETTNFVQQSKVFKILNFFLSFSGLRACKSGLVSVLSNQIFSRGEYDAI